MASEAPTTQPDEQESTSRFEPASWRVAVVAIVFGVLTGFLAAWATANLNLSGIAFAVVGVGAAAFLWKKRFATEAIGSGLYIAALELALLPIAFYVPNFLSAGDAETAEEVGMAIGSVLGLFIWGFVFVIIAIVVGAIGYFFKRRAAKKLDAADG